MAADSVEANPYYVGLSFENNDSASHSSAGTDYLEYNKIELKRAKL